MYCILFQIIFIYQVICSDILYIKSISGKQISIPCLTSDWDENEVLLVLWYRENSGVPFYKLDSRNRQLFKAKHILIPNDLSNRFVFDVTINPPVLRINPVQNEDEGEYRCRVDYRKRRTQSFSTFLEVFGPPKEIKIYEKFGQNLEGLIGPYDEFTNVELICEAISGNPSPSLIWFQTGVLEIMIDSTFRVNTSGTVVNELNLKNLNRKDYKTQLTCRASSGGYYEPIDKTVTIDMNLKPLAVDIQTDNVPIISDTPAQFRCSSQGSIPLAQINWTIGSESLTDFYITEDEVSNTTESVVSFVPNFKHNNQYLTCLAFNPRLPDSTIEDRLLLNVEFMPQIHITLDTTHTSAENIIEGDSVWISCSVVANPGVSHIEWSLNGKLIKNPNLSEDNQTLVLNRIKRNQSGKYQCTANNSIGTTISDVLVLTVKFAPVCKIGQQIYYNVVRNLINRILCSVEANPADSSLKFKWFVNTSIELFELKTTDRLENDLTTSIGNYRPKTIMSYAMILCIAENSVGVQRDPCIFYLKISTGPPEPIRSCDIINKSQTIISVECLPGNNGGIPQNFHLEVYKTLTEELHSNHTSVKPYFIVDSLLPETLYNIIVYSSNAKGSSIGLTYHSVRLPTFEASNKTQKDLNPLLNSFIGIVTSIVIFCVFVGIVIRIRSFIYEDEYKVYQKYYENKRFSTETDDNEEREHHDLMSVNTVQCSDNEPGNSRLSTFKKLTNRLKATKCKAYEATGIGKYKQVSDNTQSNKRVVTFAIFDETASDDEPDDEEYDERPIDVELEQDQLDDLNVDQVIVEQNCSEKNKKFTRDGKRRSRFFRKSFLRKTL